MRRRLTRAKLNRPVALLSIAICCLVAALADADEIDDIVEYWMNIHDGQVASQCSEYMGDPQAHLNCINGFWIQARSQYQSTHSSYVAQMNANECNDWFSTQIHDQPNPTCGQLHANAIIAYLLIAECNAMLSS